MPIDVNLAAQKYATVTPQMAGVWQQRAAANAEKWEQNAKSRQAEEYWRQRITEAAQNQARLRGLERVTANDFVAGINAGATVYQQKVQTIAPRKWAEKFEPYARVIDSVTERLPPKTTDVQQNVMNRVVPIAQALRQAKVGRATVGITRTAIRTPAPTLGGLR